MKNILTIASVLLLLITAACTKDEVQPTVTTSPPVPLKFKLFAGKDTAIAWPFTSSNLSGSYSYDKSYNLQVKTTWSKFSGPASGTIINPDSLNTRVTGLEPGEYIFELKARFQNMEIREQVKISVTKPDIAPREIIFRNLTWFVPWYATLELKHFYNLVPELKPGVPFKIYINRPPATNWTEVEPTPLVYSNTLPLYEYFFVDKDNDYYKKENLYIMYYGQDITDAPNVKIVY